MELSSGPSSTVNKVNKCIPGADPRFQIKLDVKGETKKAKKREDESPGKFVYRVRGPPWSCHIKKVTNNLVKQNEAHIYDFNHKQVKF